jgi:ubiquinone/menaquinone biosynthesis C-methylase UbiE
MSKSQHSFVASHYAPRAAAYVSSAVHAGGADLDQIEAFVRARPGGRILDLGCGGGHVSYRAAPHARQVVACDLTPDMLALVKQTAGERGLENIVVELAAAERLPFADESFDIVLCRYSAHHWDNLEAGLREARRVLKRAGGALFADGIAPAHPMLDTHLQAIELLRDPSHVRNYILAEWTAALARSGFAVAALTPRKLRLEFEVWTQRTKTPELYVNALRMIQRQASAAVRDHFAIGEDGGFELDTLVIEAVAG